MTVFWNNTTYIIDTETTDYCPDKNERNIAFVAYSLSLNSNVNHGKHCAILLDRENNVVHTFVNKKTIKDDDNKMYTVHAEAGLISEYVMYNPETCIAGYKIIVVRGSKLNFKTNSRPCKKCYSVMKHSGIYKVVYSMDGVERYGCIFF